MSSFTIEFEFQDGTTLTTAMRPRGIKNSAGDRPYYATITCLKKELVHIEQEQFKALVFKDIPSTLAGGYIQKGRVMLKPFWFHKIMTTKDKR